MKMTKQAHRWIRVQNITFYLLFIVAIGLLAFVSREYSFQLDWTYGKRNSLSESTQNLLENLEQPLSFTAYVPEDPALHEQLRRLIAKYQQIKPDTQLEFVNPDLQPKRAEADQIQYSGQMVIRLGGKQEVVEATAESVIANALQRMSRGGERLVIFFEGHGEREALATESTGMSKLVEALKQSGFDIQPYQLVKTQMIPANARFVVLAAPKTKWLEGEVKVLVDYVEQGGNLLWLHDPSDMKGLESLADVLGITIADGTVVDANEQLQAMLGIQHPAVIPVVNYGRSPITKNVKTQTFFPFATLVQKNALADKEGIQWKTEAFLTSFDHSWLESGSIIDKVVFDDTDGDILGPITIGLSLQRELESKDESQKARQQRIAVIGDSDFMLNSFIGFGANLDLVTQLFNWLSDDDNLLGVTTVSAPDTQFDMNQALGASLALFFLLGLPLLLVGAGFFIWFRRKRR